MKTKLLSISLLLCMSAAAQGFGVTGSAEVLSGAGRTSCDYVQLWDGGPKWATFNVGATITDYANLTVGAEYTPFGSYAAQAPYYNTANVGGLYAWGQPSDNGRVSAWDYDVTTGVADVATTLWGENWETPTYDQLDTLLDESYGKTSWTWCDGSTTQYVAGCTLAGYKVTGVGEYAGYSIFLPAAGVFVADDDVLNSMIYLASYLGNYWSIERSGSELAYMLSVRPDLRTMSSDPVKEGKTVRAVLVESENPGTGNMTQKVVKTAPATKTVRDGQLIIQRDGKNYTVHGVEVNM